MKVILRIFGSLVLVINLFFMPSQTFCSQAPQTVTLPSLATDSIQLEDGEIAEDSIKVNEVFQNSIEEACNAYSLMKGLSIIRWLAKKEKLTNWINKIDKEISEISHFQCRIKSAFIKEFKDSSLPGYLNLIHKEDEGRFVEMAAALYVKDQENVIDFGNVIGFGLELEIYKQSQEQGFRENIFVRLDSSKTANPTMLPVMLEFDLITEKCLIEAKSHTEQSAKQHNNQIAVLKFLQHVYTHRSYLEMHEFHSNGSEILEIKQNSKLGIDDDICLKSNWINQNNGQEISWSQLLESLAKTELQLLTRQKLFSWVKKKYPLVPTQELPQPIPHSPERKFSYDVALQYALQVKNNELASWITTQHISNLGDLNKDLSTAAWHGHAEVVNALLNALKDLNNAKLLEQAFRARTDEGSTPLHCAAWQGHTEIVNALLKALKDLKNDDSLEQALLATNNKGSTPLHCAAWQGHTDVVKTLIETLKDLKNDDLLENALLTTKNEDSNPLHCAAWQGHTEVVKVLLKALKNAGLLEDALLATDKKGSTPLHCAAWQGHTEVVKALLKALKNFKNSGLLKGALRARNNKTSTPLHCAAWQGHTKVVKALLKTLKNAGLLEDALLTTKNEGSTPLHNASLQGHTKVVKALLKTFKNAGLLEDALLATNNKDSTPLHCAAWQGQVDVAKKILKQLERAPKLSHKILFMKNQFDKTPLDEVKIKKLNTLRHAENYRKIESLLMKAADELNSPTQKTKSDNKRKRSLNSADNDDDGRRKRSRKE